MSLKFDPKGWAVPSATVRLVPSARNNIFDVATGDRPLGLMWQASTVDTPGMEQAAAIRVWKPLRDPATSWHFYVEADGTLIQSLPLTLAGWHTPRPGRIAGKLFGNVSRATLAIRLPAQPPTAATIASSAALVRALAVRLKLGREACGYAAGDFYAPPSTPSWMPGFLQAVLQEVFGP